MIRIASLISIFLLFGTFCQAQLPINTVPSAEENDLPLAFFISGDGGWNSFDQSVSGMLAGRGITVAGLDAQKYFWNAKKPEVFTPELSRAIQSNLDHYHKKSFILIGYSFGASVSTFFVSNMAPALKAKMKAIFLLSPDEKADFEIHIMDMLSIGSKKDVYDVLAEIRKISSLRPFCLFGAQEDAALTNRFRAAGATILTVPGNHHYNNDYRAVSDIIVRNIPKG